MLIIYTGSGKGKTTASFGMALRASGYGKKVLIIQFVKEESWPEGARLAIRKNLPNIEIKALGSGWVGIMGDKKPLSDHKKSAHKAVQEAIKAIKSKKYDLIILDELLGTLHGKLISKKNVQDILLANTPRHSGNSERSVEASRIARVHKRDAGHLPAEASAQAGTSMTKEVDLVLTGRNAPFWLIKKADLVTEMKEVKHPFQKGIQAIKGIDY